MSFINFSNHPSKLWNEAQLDAAKKLSRDNRVEDAAFPLVSPHWNEADVAEAAGQAANQILAMSPDVVMVQGEYGLAVKVISILAKNGIPTVHACSERKTLEWQGDDGKTIKQTVFEFIQFRRYIL